MKDSQIIYCPKCHGRVGVYDGRQTINYIGKCDKCRKCVIYHIDTGKTEAKDIPKRNCSSGVTFI